MPRPTILIVEDERLVALDIERCLAERQYNTVAAFSGEEALDKLDESRPDLVLMDIMLNGGIDGIEAARRIREVRDIPVIYLTAYTDESTLDRARLTEPYGYVLKPYEPRELGATIAMALQRHWSDRYRRQQDELQRFLSDASVRLAESLDYLTVVRRAADLIVTRHADWCLIRLKQTDDDIPALSLIHPSTEHEGPSWEDGSILASLLGTARAAIHATISDPAKAHELLGRQHLDAIHALGLTPRSVLGLPLIARGRTLGAVLLVSAADRPRESSDLGFAEDLAHRLSMALDNALLYRQAQRATQMREEILAVVAHDLRSQLSTILVRAQMLAEGLPVPSGPQLIVRSAEQMNRLIGDLLDAASVDAGRMYFERQPQVAKELALEAIEMMLPLAGEKSLIIRNELPCTGVRVFCDRGRILQVLSNLLGNAIKFTPCGGTITLRAKQEQSRVRFTISDTGPGIPPEQLPHLFERFWHADSRHAGTGLGLFIAKGIIEAHDGTIGVESHVGRGTTFYFTLPIAPSIEAHAGGP